MNNDRNQATVTASYINEWADRYFRKRHGLDTTIADLLARSTEDFVQIELEFRDPPSLRNVCVTRDENDLAEIGFEFDFDAMNRILIRNHDISELIRNVRKEIWNQENQLMRCLESHDMAVIWDGPDAPRVEFKLGVSFYFDEEIDWLKFKKTFQGFSGSHADMDLRYIHHKAMELSHVVKEIIMKIDSLYGDVGNDSRNPDDGYRITVHGYPDTFHFFVNHKLSRTPEDMETRHRILVARMEALQIDSPNHNYEDYVIESIERREDGEVWHLGS